MTSRRVVVDDNDPQMQYSGKWYLDNQNLDDIGNFGAPFQHTSHATNTNSSGLTFQFQGSGPQVFGTNTVKNISGVLDPSWTCFVDGVSIGTTPPSTIVNNHVLLCDGKNITDGNHTLTVDAMMQHGSFWFDYVTYIPSATVSLESAIIQVDRLDPAIVYDSGWGHLGDFANFTQTFGSRLKMDFIGKSVSWVGYIPRELAIAPASATYSIDGGNPESFRLNGLPTDDSTSIYNQVFFTTPDLKPGRHSLVVTHDGGKDDTPLTLNYLLIANASAPSLPPAPSTPAPSTTISDKEPAPSTPIGAIIGGIVGGIAVLCLVAFFLWRWKRRRRIIVYDRADIDPDDELIPSHPYIITPFDPRSSGSTMVETSARTSNIYYTAVANPSELPRSSSPDDGASSMVLQSRPSEDFSVRRKVPPRPPPTVRVHEDSGVRGITDGEVVELPPNYTPG